MTRSGLGNTIRELFRLLGAGNRARAMVLLFVALGGAGLEVVAGLAVVALSAAVTGDTVRIPVFGEIGFGGSRGEALVASVLFVLFFAFKAAYTVVARYIEGRVAEGVGVRLARRVVDAYLRAPYSFHLRRNSAELIRNAHTSVDQIVSLGIRPLATLLTQGLVVVGLTALLVSAAPVVAVSVVALLVLTLLGIQRFVRPRIRALGRQAQGEAGEVLRWLQQGFGAIRDVTVLGRQRAVLGQFVRARARLARARYLRETLGAVPNALIEFAIVASLVGVVGATVLSGNDPVDALPTLGLFAYAGFRLKPATQQVVKAVNSLHFVAAPIEELRTDLAALEGRLEEVGEVEPWPFREALRMDDVAFRYEAAHQPALSGVDLVVRPGEQIGICGPTGGGKTTLVDLIAGLLEPTAGTITVDGEDLRVVRRRWQAALGVVPQEVVLIDDTIRRNIAFGVPHDEIDDEAVREAVRLAQLDPFVAELPEGLDTVVGERGVRLSGGQRQRIAIARALYRRPQVLLFDEGTSALDNATEAEVMKAIEGLRGRLTVVIVAHRLSTVEKADRILFVRSGRIEATGPYAQLVETSPAFAAMAGR